MTHWYQNTLLILAVVLNSSTVFVSSNGGSGSMTGNSSSLLYAMDSATVNMMLVTPTLEPSTLVSTLNDMTVTVLVSTDDGQLSITPSFFDTTSMIIPNRNSSQGISILTETPDSPSSTIFSIHATTAMRTTQMFSTSTKFKPSETTVNFRSISSTSIVSTTKRPHPTSSRLSTTSSALTTSTSVASSKSTTVHRNTVPRQITTISISTMAIPSNFFTTTTTRAVPNRSTAPELSSGALTGIVIGGLLVLLFLMLIIVSIIKYFIAERKKSTHWNEMRPLENNADEQDTDENAYKLL